VLQQQQTRFGGFFVALNNCELSSKIPQGAPQAVLVQQ
jgi:hypothetical protein